MYTLEQIRKNLIEAIKNSGFTQTEIAERLHIKPQSVNDYVRGKSLPALDTFANLCAILDVEADYILGLRDFEGNLTYKK